MSVIENHYNRYINFIYSRRFRKIPKKCVTHIHHIIPKCLNGTGHKKNLIPLTLREHFIAHLILWKAFGGKLSFTFHMMTNQKQYGNKLTSRQYSNLESERISLYKGRTIEEIYGEDRAKEIKYKMGATNRGKTYEELYGDEKGKKLREARAESKKGKNRSMDSRRNQSKNHPRKRGKENPFYGKKHTKECIENSRKRCLGKTYEDLYGKEKAIQMKENRKKAIGKRKWVTNGEENKLIKEENINEFLDLNSNWYFGKTNHKFL